jgi:hypothetical protein
MRSLLKPNNAGELEAHLPCRGIADYFHGFENKKQYDNKEHPHNSTQGTIPNGPVVCSDSIHGDLYREKTPCDCVAIRMTTQRSWQK